MVLWTYYEFTLGHLLLKLESPLNTAEPCEALQMHLYTNIGAGLGKKILMMGLVPQIGPSVPQPVFTITEKAPTRAFSWLKVPTSTFTFKTLLRHYAKRVLTPR